jgi:hypothetical protein
MKSCYNICFLHVLQRSEAERSRQLWRRRMIERDSPGDEMPNQVFSVRVLPLLL